MAHERFKALATKLISANGAPAQLVSFTTSGPSYNPTRTEEITDITAFNSAIDTREIDGSIIKTDDLRFLIDSSVEPELHHRFRYELRDYEIKHIKKLKPADTTILYNVIVTNGVAYEIVISQVGWNDVDAIGWDEDDSIGWNE